MIFFKKNIFFFIFFIKIYSIFDIKRSFFEKNKKNFSAVLGTGIFYLYAKNFYEKKFSKNIVYFNKILKNLKYKIQEKNNNNNYANDFENFKSKLKDYLMPFYAIQKINENSSLIKEEKNLNIQNEKSEFIINKENEENEENFFKEILLNVNIFYNEKILNRDLSKNKLREEEIKELYKEVLDFLFFYENKNKEREENIFKKEKNSNDDIKVKKIILTNFLFLFFKKKNFLDKKESDFNDLADFLIRCFEIKKVSPKKNYFLSFIFFLKGQFPGIFGLFNLFTNN